MVTTSHTATDNIQKNPIHIDSKWFKKIIALTGSMEKAMLLADAMIYYRNRYKAFKVGDDYLYGLKYSAKEYQKILHISYRKAMNLPKQLVENGFLKPHRKKLICNRTFYTPTKKALDSLYKIHFSGINNNLENKKAEPKKIQPHISAIADIKMPILASSSVGNHVELLLRTRTTASAYTHNPYKDKNKNKKNNNLLKYYSLLKVLQSYNVKTALFDFDKFQLGNVKCEAEVIDYLTAQQSGMINTLASCYRNSIDIPTFNQVLINRPNQKKEVDSFRKMVNLAYVESTKKKRRLAKNQSVKGVIINSTVKPIAKDKIILVTTKNNNQVVNVFPEMTTDTTGTLLSQRQKHRKDVTSNQIEEKRPCNKKILSQNTKTTIITPEEVKPTLRQSSYVLNQSNKLYFLETLSKKGINDEVLILKTAENILHEYTNLSFNDLLDGLIYRLVRLPKKRKQQKLVNQEFTMEINSKTCSFMSTTKMKEKATDKQNGNDKNIITNVPHQNLSVMVENTSKNITEAEKTQDKITEQLNNITKKESDLLNRFNRALLIEGLNVAGVQDENLILGSAKEIMAEYPEIKFKELVDGVIYRLVTLPFKQKNPNKINQSLLAKFNSISGSTNLKFTNAVAASQSKLIQTNGIGLPRLSNLKMPHVNKSILRQDWASKAKQDFYKGSLPNSQKMALVAIIDYVKRKGVTLTVSQEVYEWLYHMASNKDYYYSRANNFKHWCNIVIRQLMQHRLHKPVGFDRWRRRVEAYSSLVAA